MEQDKPIYTETITAQYKGETNITVSLWEDGFFEFFKPKYSYVIDDDDFHYDSRVYGDWIAGWGTGEEIVASLASFMEFYLETCTVAIVGDEMTIMTEENEKLPLTLWQLANQHVDTWVIRSMIENDR
jgi:hypothetical protein